MGEGYVQKRRGIIQHLRDGRMTLLEYGAYDLILLLANKATGIWVGSAKALAANCGASDVSDRQARHILESLESSSYVKRFAVARSHRNYPILINRFFVSFGAHSGCVLNAIKTTDWKHPVYDKVPTVSLQEGAEEGAEDGAERAPILDLRPETLRPEKKPRRAAKTAAPDLPALPDWIPVLEWNAYLEMRARNRKPVKTAHAFSVLVRDLGKLRSEGEDLTEVLNQSVAYSWQGFFAIKKGAKNGRPDGAKQRQEANSKNPRKNSWKTLKHTGWLSLGSTSREDLISELSVVAYSEGLKEL